MYFFISAGPNQPGLTGVSVSWLSTYEFLIGVRDTERPSCWLITGSKSGAIQQSNLEDICYSTGKLFFPSKFYPYSSYKGCGSKSVHFSFIVYFLKYTDLFPHPLIYFIGEGVLTKYKSHNISEWGVVCVASSTSLELGVLGQSPEHGYVQWTLEDNARFRFGNCLIKFTALIPLSDKSQCIGELKFIFRMQIKP